jgi:hypothetical protein
MKDAERKYSIIIFVVFRGRPYHSHAAMIALKRSVLDMKCVSSRAVCPWAIGSVRSLPVIYATSVIFKGLRSMANHVASVLVEK